MKNKFSSRVRDIASYQYTELPAEVESILLEAANTLEHNEKDIDNLNNRLKAADIRYRNLYDDRQQIIKDFRTTLIVIAVVGTLLSLGIYFL